MTVTISTIGIGTVAEDKTGDPARTAFGKCNDNFSALKTAVDAVQAGTLPDTIFGPDADGQFTVQATTGAGSTGVVFYGGSHATKAQDMEFNFGGTTKLAYDFSVGAWTSSVSFNIGGPSTIAGNWAPSTDSTNTNGTSSLAWSNSFSDKFTLASGSTVAGLGTPSVGMIARVTDADTPAIGSTVVGGAAAAALVWYNGSNWTVIGV